VTQHTPATTLRVLFDSLQSQGDSPEVAAQTHLFSLEGNVGEGDRLATTSAALSAFDDIARASRNTTFTITMATNGTLTPLSLPPAPASPSAAKRKYAATKSIVSNGASVSAQGQTAVKSTYTLQMVLEDILSILQRYVTIRRKSCTLAIIGLHATCARCSHKPWVDNDSHCAIMKMKLIESYITDMQQL
jgi:hypothetical protein